MKRDWFFLKREAAKPLFGVPGIKFSGTEAFEVHRSHLPLVCNSDAGAKLLKETFERGYGTNKRWAARDARTKPLGFTCRTTQQRAIDFIEQRRGTLLGDDMRLGKGHVLGTRLAVPSGWQKIEDVHVGDCIFGRDGKPCTVTGVFPRGCLPVFRVTFSDGVSLRVDGEHLWTAWDHNDWHRGKAPRTLSTTELAPQLRDANNLRWRIPLVAPLEFEERELALDPYALGVLLGDGSLTGKAVTFCCGDEQVPEEMARVLPLGVTLTRYASQPGKADVWGISKIGATNPVVAMLRGLGLMGSRSEMKFIPDCYLFSAPAQRLALLQGLLDTDGEYSSGVLGFSSASETLRDGVRFLVESLGGVARAGIKKEPRFTYRGEVRIGQPSYRLTIAMPSGLAPFRARKGYKSRTKFQPTRHIKSIEPDGENEVICISVDAPDQLYVTEHCIVTHNTLSALMSHDPARGPLVICAPLQARGVWLGWIKRVFPDVPVGVLIGKTFIPELVQNPIVFVHYEILHQWQVILNIGTLVFDEAHFLTNVASRRAKAAALLASRAEVVIAMTGTPIWNLPPNLFGVISLATPGAWGSYYDFAGRYGAPVPTAHGIKYTGISNGEELAQRMTEVMLRRTWREVGGDDLPPITRNVVIATVNDATRKKLDIIAASLREEKTNTAGNLASYRRAASMFKLTTVIEEAETILERNEPLVIWAWHVDTATKIAERLREAGKIDDKFPERVFLITGEQSVHQREERIAAWKACPSGALICTMAVAQTAVDFSHARLAIFAELDWTPGVIAQAEMRTYSPTRSMNITFIVLDHIVDQRLVIALERKLNASSSIGVGTAAESIDALRIAVFGEKEEGDMTRFLDDLLAA